MNKEKITVDVFLKKEATKMGMIPSREYFKKRLNFIKWARSQRYTLKAIGQVLGTSKHGIYKNLRDARMRNRGVDN